MITVKPSPIDPAGQAQVSHDKPTDTVITITNDDGGSETITVPPNTTVNWTPPAGWTEARFKGGGCPEVFRYIEAQSGAGG